MDVGNALLGIREDRQYVEAGFPNFEAYCQRRWNLRREVADRYVRAAQVVAAVNPMGLPAPTTERVARELAPLRDAPERIQAAWSETVERHGPTPTAAQVRDVVRAEVVDAPADDPATAWFKTGEKQLKDRVSELYRMHDGIKPLRKVDTDLLAEQIVLMDRLERQMLSGCADTFERLAGDIRRLLKTKLEAVK